MQTRFLFAAMLLIFVSLFYCPSIFLKLFKVLGCFLVSFVMLLNHVDSLLHNLCRVCCECKCRQSMSVKLQSCRLLRTTAGDTAWSWQKVQTVYSSQHIVIVYRFCDHGRSQKLELGRAVLGQKGWK